MKHQEIQAQSLLSEVDQQQHALPAEKPQKYKTFTKKELILGLSLFITIVVVMIIVFLTRNSTPVPIDGSPQSIRIALPSQPTKIELGNGRVIEVIFYSGMDDRNSDDYKVVSKRDVTWTLSKEGVISIDDYGRVETLSVGDVTVKVQSKCNTSAIDEKQITVIPKKQGLSMGKVKRIINFTGTPTKPRSNPQKIVTRFSKAQAASNENVPSSFKGLSDGITEQLIQRQVKQNLISWRIVNYADRSIRSYVLRTDETLSEQDRDKYQYFIGNRYLPGEGFQALSIEDDGNQGIWVFNSAGEASHIQFVAMSATEKAFKMVEDYKPYLRYGLASGTDKIGDRWIAGVSDNDGLWTSMFAVGQLMRYNSLKQLNYSLSDIQTARTSALASLKAVLMISNVACRNTTVGSRLRYMNNTRAGQGNVFNQNYLKEGKTYSYNNYPGNAADGDGFYGMDAGKVVQGLQYGGKERYDYQPFNKEDWGTNVSIDKPAVTKRTIVGFIARSFGISGIDSVPSGLFFQHNANGTQTVLGSANKLYDYKQDQHPVLNLGNESIPQILMDIVRVNGVQYNKSDLFYKGDTSTDQVIGHIFLYKVAYDILDESNSQELQLKKLISNTMNNFCTGLIDNGYSFVDATGYGTTWGKLNRDFIISDSTLEDAPVKAIEMLMSLKVCGYVTGEDKWEKEYRFLIEDPAHRYLDVVASLWRRWRWRTFNEDYSVNPFCGHLLQNETYSEDQILRHIMQEIHFSDDEQMMLAYYLAFQLQSDQALLQKYREGLQGWWRHISRSENPIWYFIYQLAYPNQHSIQDYFNNSILDISAWHLSRHPVSTVKSTAYVEGSRPDVISQGQHPVLSLNPFKVLTRRKHVPDAIFNNRTINHYIFPDYDPMNVYEIKNLPKDERVIQKFNHAAYEQFYGGNANSMQPSTTYTLPFWLGVYHKMIDLS